MKWIGKKGGGGRGGHRGALGLDREILDLERFGEVRHSVLTMFNAVCVIIYAICATRLIVGVKGWKKKYQWLCLEKKRKCAVDEVVWRISVAPCNRNN